jgi:hypothetical protein
MTRQTSKLLAALVLFLAAVLGYAPDALAMTLPLVLGDTDDDAAGGDDGGGDEGGEDAGEGGDEGTEEPPDPAARPTPFADRMAELRAEVAEEQRAAEAAAAGAQQTAEEGEDQEEEAEEQEEAAEEVQEGEEEEAEDTQAAEADDDAVIYVAVPAREKGREDFELPIDVEFLEALGIDPKDVVERINQLKNGNMYRADAEAAVAAVENDRAELDAIYETMQADPVGFLVQHVDEGLRGQVVDELLVQLDDEALRGLAQRIQHYTRDPESRELAKTKAERDRLKRERDRLASSGEADQQKAYTRDLRTAISSVVPEGATKNVADMFVRTAARELQLYARDNKLTTLEPAKIPAILAEIGLLEAYKFPASNGRGASRAEAPTTNSSGKKPEVGEKPAKGARVDRAEVATVRDRLKRRKSASATTPAGAGSAAPAGFQKVPGESYLERRNRLARALNLKEKKEL